MPREEAGSIDGYQASITAKMIINALNDIETLVIVFAVLITLSMVIRVYVRLTMTKVWGREDWAMVVTYVRRSGRSHQDISDCCRHVQ